jgi:diguanylate cyclase (GGDEF)-like protein
VAKYGGEEFSVLLPGTAADEALKMSERFRAAVRKGPWNAREITISVGVTSRESPRGEDAGTEMSADMLLTEADEALYFSKNNGKNRVTHFLSGEMTR